MELLIVILAVIGIYALIFSFYTLFQTKSFVIIKYKKTFHIVSMFVSVIIGGMCCLFAWYFNLLGNDFIYKLSFGLLYISLIFPGVYLLMLPLLLFSKKKKVNQPFIIEMKANEYEIRSDLNYIGCVIANVTRFAIWNHNENGVLKNDIVLFQGPSPSVAADIKAVVQKSEDEKYLICTSYLANNSKREKTKEEKKEIKYNIMLWYGLIVSPIFLILYYLFPNYKVADEFDFLTYFASGLIQAFFAVGRNLFKNGTDSATKVVYYLAVILLWVVAIENIIIVLSLILGI